jgi:hypothetical protein
VFNDVKHLVCIVDDMPLLNSDIEALMAKKPETTAFGGVFKDVTKCIYLIRGDIGILPIDAFSVSTIASTVGLVICIKEDEVYVARTANEGRTDEIRNAIKNIVSEIAEVVVTLHHENRNRAVADDLSNARKMLHIVGATYAAVNNVTKADGKINALVFEILEYFVYTPVSQTSGRLKIPPLNALSALLIY